MSFVVSGFADSSHSRTPYASRLLPNLAFVLSNAHASLRTLSLAHHPFSHSELADLLSPFTSLTSLFLSLPDDPSPSVLSHFWDTLGTNLPLVTSLALAPLSRSSQAKALPILFDDLSLLPPLRHLPFPPPLFPALRCITLLPPTPAPPQPAAVEFHSSALLNALAHVAQRFKRGTYGEQLRYAIEVVGDTLYGKEVEAKVRVLRRGGVDIEWRREPARNHLVAPCESKRDQDKRRKAQPGKREEK